MKRQYTPEEYQEWWDNLDLLEYLTGPICFCSCYIGPEHHHESCPNYKEKEVEDKE